MAHKGVSPMKAIIENQRVIIELKECIKNERFNCETFCNRGPNCSTRNEVKEYAAIDTSDFSDLVVTTATFDIVNAGTDAFDAFNDQWIMIDSDGYAHEGLHDCTKLWPRESDGVVASMTRKRVKIAFTPLPDDCGVYQLRYAGFVGDASFTVGKLSEAAEIVFAEAAAMFDAAKEENPKVSKEEATPHDSGNGASTPRDDGESNLLTRIIEVPAAAKKKMDALEYEMHKRLHNTLSKSGRISCENEISNLSFEVRRLLATFEPEERALTENALNLLVRNYQQKLGRQRGDSLFISGENDEPMFRSDLQSAFRSSWEANIARLLNQIGIKWEYEKETFSLSKEANPDSVYYLPDFFLPNRVILEVKGFWDNGSLEKVYGFSRQCPEYKILMLDSDYYYYFHQRFKDEVPNWEGDVLGISTAFVKVVGLGYNDRRFAIEKLQVDDVVHLVPEPNNQYDPNAILVVTDTGEDVGYISKEWAYVYSQKIADGFLFEARVCTIKPKIIVLKVKPSGTSTDVVENFLKRLHS